jgi:hypothetical protein
MVEQYLLLPCSEMCLKHCKEYKQAQQIVELINPKLKIKKNKKELQ